MTAAPSVDTYPSAYGPGLLLQHARLLADSAISVEVAQARRYMSVEVVSRQGWGFGWWFPGGLIARLPRPELELAADRISVED